MSDILKKYLAADRSTRIQILQLDQSWKTGLAHQELPPLIQRFMGELAAACALLAANIKFDGSVVLQLQGNGPVRLVMVECTSGMQIRATAHLRDNAVMPARATMQSLMNADGQGRFTVMLDPSARRAGVSAYQGIVPLQGDDVAAALEHYMQHSEQLDTRLWLAADDSQCAGLLLQRLPVGQDDEQHASAHETWAHFQTLAETLKPGELLEFTPDELIHRLYWADELLVLPDQKVSWHCPCSRERVAGMLYRLGKHEIDSILSEQGKVHIDCSFCGRGYDFDAVDCASLFAGTDGGPHATGPDTLH